MRWRMGSLLSAAAVAVVLSGCTAPAPEPAPSTPVAAPSSTPVPSATPDPVLDPAAGAAGNVAFFDFVNRRLVAAQPQADGRALVDNLVTAGFDKSRMEVTPDRTAVDLPADSVQFSIRFDDGCLVGQLGADTGYVSQVRGVLSTGRCLIGDTRPIDW
ncbi:MAG: hypothetical protein ABWZ77_07230 [Naasia sp.]